MDKQRKLQGALKISARIKMERECNAEYAQRVHEAQGPIDIPWHTMALERNESRIAILEKKLAEHKRELKALYHAS